MITYRPISQLISIVKNDFKAYEAEGMIDDGTLIKTIMYCNERLGFLIRDVKEKCLVVNDYKAELPLDFDKLYYSCALQATNTSISAITNPFDNNVDQDIVYEAELDRQSLGNVDSYQVIVKRLSNTTVYTHGSWIELDVAPSTHKQCHMDCPNKMKKGKYTISIHDDYISTPFKSGLLYIMYIGLMTNEDGEILYPFHPLITPYYEWSIKEKIVMDMIFNSDNKSAPELLKLCQLEKNKAWLDAFNYTTERSYGEALSSQRKRELGWYNKYFKFFM